MFEWIKGKRRKKAPARKLELRSASDDALRLELAEFAPDIMTFLGLTTYLQLELYQAAARAVAGAPTLKAKEVLAHSAGITLGKHQQLGDELRKRGRQPDLVMLPYTGSIDRYLERIDTTDWHQHVLSIYLVGGLFDGFFAELAKGLKDNFRSDAIKILSDNTGRDELRDLLAAEIAVDPKLANRLALWGRRLVGDTLLVTREVLSLSDGRTFVASHVEPVLTQLIGDHTRRMDNLGLTA